MTEEEALKKLDALPAYQRLPEYKQKNCKRVLNCWFQVRAETPSNERVLVTRVVKKHGSSSVVYAYISIVRAALGDELGSASAAEPHDDASHQLPPEFSELFAPILLKMQMFPELLGRIYASNVANEISHARASFAQERASLLESSAHANLQAEEHEKHAIGLAETNDELDSLLEAARGEIRHLTEQMAAANHHIDAAEAGQNIAAARITNLEAADRDRQLEVDDLQRRLDEMGQRVTQAEDERRSVTQLREADGVRFRAEISDLRSEHLRELAALRADLERQFAAERDRIAFDLAIVTAFKSTVTSTAVEKEASDV